MNSSKEVALRHKLDSVVRREKELLTIPWLFVTGAIGLCALFVAFWTYDESPREPAAAVRYLVFVLGAALAVLSLVLPSLMKSDARIAAHMRRDPNLRELAKLPFRRDVDAELLRGLRVLPAREQRLASLAAFFLRPYLVGLGLSSGVTVLGTIYGIAAMNLVAAFPLFATAFALNLVLFPRLTPLVDRGRRHDRPDEELAGLEQTLRQVQRDLRRKPPVSSGKSRRPPPVR